MLILNELLLRSFYSYETSELYSDYDMGNSSMSSPLGTSSLLQNQVTKKEKREGDGAGVRLTSRKSKSKPNKHSPSRELNGTEIMLLSHILPKKEDFF